MLQGNRQTGERASGDSALAGEFVAFVAQEGFPCLGAKAAINGKTYKIKVLDELSAPASSLSLADSLERFVLGHQEREEYVTFIAIFRNPQGVSEEEFEALLWSQLGQLHELDKHSWDPAVSSDPGDPHFSFSFAGQGLYVVGLHPHSSRLARQFAWPTLIFNPHAQFERLRHDGKWRRMQESIRHRDDGLAGERESNVKRLWGAVGSTAIFWTAGGGELARALSTGHSS